MQKLQRLPFDDATHTYKMQVIQRQMKVIHPHWHDFYELELCLEGTGSTVVNGKTYPVEPNTLVFLTPVDVHSIKADDQITLLNFTFSQECVEDSGLTELLALSNYIVSPLNSQTADWLVSLLSKIQSECSKDRFLQSSYLSQLLSCIFIELLRISRQNNKAEKDHTDISQPVQKAIYYIHSHFRKAITLTDVAVYAGFSAGHMSRQLHLALGCSFKKYLTNLRLVHAERLLQFSDESVTTIAELCGFNSVSHFLHAFQEKNHVSALQFRKQASSNHQ